MFTIKEFNPISFAYVMATGSVSIIFHQLGWPYLSLLFLVLGCLGYLWFIALFTYRLFTSGRNIIKEILDSQKMLKYFTFSSGTNTLAVCFSSANENLISLILGCFGIVVTLLLIYTLFCLLFFHSSNTLQKITPFWLLMCISCNTSGIVITTLWNHDVFSSTILFLLAFTFWSFGVLIYLIFMALNIYRMFFFSFEGKDLSPSYWTCMGAAAIAVFDGGNFIMAKNAPLFLASIKPFIVGMIFVLWSWASMLIPILCCMGIWKYFYFKIPFQYEPTLWSMVFPLGMYTAATHILTFFHLEILKEVAIVWLWITCSVWIVIALLSRSTFYSRRKI